MIGPGQAPTRAAVLELQNEQVVVNEAYVFLDEKRLLLASELLRQLRVHQRLSEEVEEIRQKAKEVMEAAVLHHGLNGLQVYPSASLQGAELTHASYNFMGVTLVETELQTEGADLGHDVPVNASGAAESVHQLHCEMLQKIAVLAGVSGNLYRLLAEYRVTERRSRALENVILPEIDQALREMSSHLEELDLEDAIRVRLQNR